MSDNKQLYMAKEDGTIEQLVYVTDDGKYLMYDGCLYQKMEVLKPEGDSISIPKFVNDRRKK